MYKNVVARNFSKSVSSYDSHASVQKGCAEKLAGLLPDSGPRRILEIGCGTGNFTRLLREKYGCAEMIAADISACMSIAAREKVRDGNTSFVTVDAEEAEFGGKFDLIASNASFQWFRDTVAAVSRLAGELNSGGTLCFSSYGPETFRELREVFTLCLGDEARLSSDNFVGCDKIAAGMKKTYAEVYSEEERMRVYFPSLMDLLKNIKLSGARGTGLGDGIFLGKKTIEDAEKLYIEKHGSIVATHHIVFFRGRYD